MVTFSLAETSTTAAAGASADLDQCTNGPTGPPVSPEPCVGSNAAAVSVAIPGINGGAATAYKNWVNGNANGSKSHWREGEYISYRAVISGVETGAVHTLVFHFDTVQNGLHAIDYLGSFDASESTAPTPTAASGALIHANNDSPCADLVSDGAFPWPCTPASPESSFALAPVQMTGASGEQGCGGSPGAFSGFQEPGELALFGPPGSAITAVTYPSQNVLSGTGACATSVKVTFTVASTVGSTRSIVLAWGGHIASTVDWGVGTGAATISGSPYHMSLDTLDGASTGSQDRALQTSAVYFTPTIGTTVMDDGVPLSGTIDLGSTVNDTATLSGADPTASGTVTYRRYSNGSCTSTAVTEQVTVASGSVPASSPFVPTAGTYSYRATYGGDGRDLPATSPCEPFGVGKRQVTIGTAVHDASNGTVLSGPLALGGSVYDTAALGDLGAPTPTGTVTYTFYSGGECVTGTAVGTQVVTLNAGGSVPRSDSHGPLDAAGGPYAFMATYSGDANYLAGSSACEPLVVGKAQATPSTVVYDAATDSPVTTVPLDADVYDTTTIAHPSTYEPTGTVTYTFYATGTCSTGSVVGTPEQVTVNSNGTVPNSGTQGPLTVSGGPYAFQVTYSGDGNYVGGTSECETLAVNQGEVSIATVVYDAATTEPSPIPAALGVSVYDTAVLTPSAGPTPTGTVTYTFFSGGTCSSGAVVSTETVDVGTGGTVPRSAATGPLSAAAGPYAFQAVYSGDADFSGGASDCEPFTVAPAALTVATTVVDATTTAPVTSPIAVGTSVHDTTLISGATGPVPTGTVIYTFFSGGDCSTGAVVGTETVTLAADGSVPDSSVHGPLTAATGPYAFRAEYEGDANYLDGTSLCEPFSVGKGEVSLSTLVHDASSGQVVSEPVPLGTSVYDSAAVGNPSVIVATGTVTYTFYAHGDCTTGTPSTPQTVSLATGAVPDSGTSGPLTAATGPYAYLASYSGDGNFQGARSDCEPLVVSRAVVTAETTVLDAATFVALVTPAPFGTSVYDTTALTRPAGPPPAGTVTYAFFASGTCVTGHLVGAAEILALSLGVPPDSSIQGPLTAGAGPYAFRAVYSGDGNYLGATSPCEPFTVARLGTSITTALPSASVVAGTAVTDTATLSGASPTASGTVTYTVYRDTSCVTVAIGGGTVPVTNGVVPNSTPVTLADVGNYYFSATYSGDANNAPSASGCAAEPLLVVASAPTGGVQTGVAATPGGSGATPWGIVLLLAGLVLAAAVVVLRRRGASPTKSP